GIGIDHHGDRRSAALGGGPDCGAPIQAHLSQSCADSTEIPNVESVSFGANREKAAVRTEFRGRRQQVYNRRFKASQNTPGLYFNELNRALSVREGGELAVVGKS